MPRAILFFALCAGCAFLPPIDEDPAQIQDPNLPPSIDPRKVTPSFDTVPVIIAQPNTLTFIIDGLQDPNPEDPLSLRLYADGQNDFIPSVTLLVEPGADIVRRRVEFTIDDELLDSFRDENGNLSGRHRLELIVSDSGFVADVGAGARQVPAAGQMGYYSWELDLDLLSD
jgi:hypothetical protein